MLYPYCFSTNSISVKSSRDVTCTLLYKLSLLPLFVYFIVLHPSIVFILVTVPIYCLWAEVVFNLGQPHSLTYGPCMHL